MKNLFKNGVIAVSMLLSSAAIAGPITYEFDIDYSGTTTIGADNYKVQGTGFFSFLGELNLGNNDLRSGGFSDLYFSAAFDFINQDNIGNDKLDYISVEVSSFISDYYDSIFVDNNLDTYFFGNRAIGFSSLSVQSENLSPSPIGQYITLYHEPGSANLNGVGKYVLTNNDDVLIVNNDRNYSMAMRNSSLGEPIPPTGGSNDVPEPSTWLLMAAGLAFTARRFKSK